MDTLNTPENIIADELTYRSFAHNVAANPHILLERWAAIFGEKTAGFIQRYQQAMNLPSTYGKTEDTQSNQHGYLN